jgi:putative alpha-1,2-mannosidase
MCTSYISLEQAVYNHTSELTDITLKEANDKAEEIWTEVLSRIEVKTSTKKQMKTFYSCLYRCFLFPHKCYEYDKAGKPVHYCPRTGKYMKE